MVELCAKGPRGVATADTVSSGCFVRYNTKKLSFNGIYFLPPNCREALELTHTDAGSEINSTIRDLLPDVKHRSKMEIEAICRDITAFLLEKKYIVSATPQKSPKRLSLACDVYHINVSTLALQSTSFSYFLTNPRKGGGIDDWNPEQESWLHSE